jgi:hypothetical protein
VLDDCENNLLNEDVLFTVPMAIPETETRVGISEDSNSLEARLRQIYPVFLHPENNVRSFQDLAGRPRGPEVTRRIRSSCIARHDSICA